MTERGSRKFLWIVLTIILTGLTLFGLLVLILRSGGIVRVLAIVIALVVAYVGYESVRAINRK
jgi:threonine/homoserine/homoserine lactone efflux protein